MSVKRATRSCARCSRGCRPAPNISSPPTSSTRSNAPSRRGPSVPTLSICVSASACFAPPFTSSFCSDGSGGSARVSTGSCSLRCCCLSSSRSLVPPCSACGTDRERRPAPDQSSDQYRVAINVEDFARAVVDHAQGDDEDDCEADPGEPGIAVEEAGYHCRADAHQRD